MKCLVIAKSQGDCEALLSENIKLNENIHFVVLRLPYIINDININVYAQLYYHKLILSFILSAKVARYEDSKQSKELLSVAATTKDLVQTEST